MSSGLIHYKYYMKGYREALPISVAFSCANPKFGAGYLLGYSFGRYCSPDWDLMGVTGDEGRMVNELKVIGHILFGMSSAYGSMFRRHHRSWFTHFPYISTIGRLALILALPVAIADSWGINLIGEGWHMLWLGIWAGLGHADTIHFYLDVYPRVD